MCRFKATPASNRVPLSIFFVRTFSLLSNRPTVFLFDGWIDRHFYFDRKFERWDELLVISKETGDSLVPSSMFELRKRGVSSIPWES